MIYLPTEKLTVGMELARNIPGINPMYPYAVAGFKLNQRIIQRIGEIGIQGVYIRTELTEGIEPEDFVEPELKAKMLKSIRTTYDQSMKEMTLQSRRKSYDNLEEAAKSVVMNILNMDNYLFQMIDIRDYDCYTYSHSLYVGILSVLLGRHIGLSISQLNDLALCGLLHDIGKTDIPISITNKPGPLTDEEYVIMKKHPELSYQILKEQASLSYMVLQGVQTHHEKYDGSGYPFRLVGQKIPLYGRILAIADVFDALNSTRPYRKAWSPKQVFDFLTSCSNTHFDPELLCSFLQCVAAYPIGTIVNLSDGSTAVVKDNTPGFSLRPVIRFITPASIAGKEVDLSCDGLNITIV